MTLTLGLTPEQEQRIEAEARRRNMDAASYAKALLFEEAAETGEEEPLPPAGPLPPANGTGADLVAYWEREGLIGTRPDITGQLRTCAGNSSQG